jgi:hypothetical protein
MRRRFRILLGVVLMTFGGLILYSVIVMVQSMTATPNVENNWLATLNSYRQSSGVNPVKENLRYTLASQHHADYLAMTATDFQVGKYQNLHKENPESPYFSRDGATLGAGVIAWTTGKYASAVDNLMTAPFHAIGMLRENLVEVGFGTAIAGENAYSPKTRVTDISVVSGLRYKPRSKVILFPGPNSTTHLNSFSGENPEPREVCSKNYREFQGLPIFASLLHRPQKNLAVSLQLPNGKILIEGKDLCVVTENNFLSTDPIYGSAGKSIIRADHLVLIIPKSPLQEGKHRVDLVESGHPNMNWSFTYKAPDLKF